MGSPQVVALFAKTALNVITSMLGLEALSQSSQQQNSPGHSLLARMQSGTEASTSQPGVLCLPATPACAGAGLEYMWHLRCLSMWFTSPQAAVRQNVTSQSTGHELRGSLELSHEQTSQHGISCSACDNPAAASRFHRVPGGDDSRSWGLGMSPRGQQYLQKLRSFMREHVEPVEPAMEVCWVLHISSRGQDGQPLSCEAAQG